MPDPREADTRLLLSMAVISLPVDPAPGEGGRRSATVRLDERLGPVLRARLVEDLVRELRHAQPPGSSQTEI